MVEELVAADAVVVGVDEPVVGATAVHADASMTATATDSGSAHAAVRVPGPLLCTDTLSPPAECDPLPGAETVWRPTWPEH